ncbi:hypothetical protein [Pleomorphomonas sp. PLEO]|uniref:hypothetical protein n=1 Tax=Pleomorphomonas sp. PLEO TaxID=3239306 RepID=UPI00351EE158
MHVAPIKHAVHDGSVTHRCFTADQAEGPSLSPNGAVLTECDSRGNRLEAIPESRKLPGLVTNDGFAACGYWRFLSALTGFVFSAGVQTERLDPACNGWQPAAIVENSCCKFFSDRRRHPLGDDLKAL